MIIAAKWTKLSLWMILGGIIVWDILLVVFGVTISEVGGLRWSYAYSTIPLAWGVLTGHLLWHARSQQNHKWLRLGCLGFIGGCSIVLDISNVYDIIPIVPAASGVPLGRLLWAQVTKEPLFRWGSKEIGK